MIIRSTGKWLARRSSSAWRATTHAVGPGGSHLGHPGARGAERSDRRGGCGCARTGGRAGGRSPAAPTRPGAPSSAPFELELLADPTRVVVELYDRDFTTHRSEGGLVELERSMLSPWRLKLVERLADRWSVTHDELFTLRFEFDSEQGMTLRDPAESA